MRKLVSATIVCAMMLTLFLGLFGGVVEEVEGTATYDAGSNTIYVSDPNQFLPDINNDIPNNIFWFANGAYHTNANIQINETASLIFNPGERLRLYNSSQTLYIIVKGILTADGNPLSPIFIESDWGAPAPGDWGGLEFVTEEASNSTLDYVYITNATTSILCDFGSDPQITNSIIDNSIDIGISITSSSPILRGSRFSNSGNGDFTDGGVYVEDSIILIENCTFINSNPSDIVLFGSTNVTMLNSTFDAGKLLTIGTYTFIVRWYLEIFVSEEDQITPIEGATVHIENNFGTEVEDSPFTTDPFGYIRWIKVTEYIEDSSSGTTNFNPHNISGTHSEHYSNYTITPIDSSMQVQLILPMIRRDLTTTSTDITFTPEGVPVAGEELTVRARIYNVEVDDAQNVRVIIVDDAPEGSQEIHNATIGEIQGLSYKNAIDIWNPTPGVHIIEVYIDPFNEISEINSTTGSGGAEGNNNVTTEISVNARPIVNISEPGNYDEVNETITIEGSSWDDPNDNVPELPGNDIFRIDLRLVGYEWIESDTPLIFNFTSGGWDWSYDWDTNYWNNTALPDDNYTLQARAWDNYHYSFLYEIPITVNNTGANMPPNAVISSPLNFTAFNVSQVITFDGSDSNDTHTMPENLIYTWDFDGTVDSDGDGDFTNDVDATGNITTYAYDKKGFFDVTLIVWDEGGLNDTTWITIEIWNYLPVADITTNSTTVYENDTVEFNGSASYDPDGAITSYTWDFDDGVILSGFLPTINHSFNESRIFNVTLTVFDNNGTYNSTWILIDVLPNEAPNAVIDEPFDTQIFSVNDTIVFNASSSSDPNDADLEYHWDFGDGTDSGWITEPLTTHHYSEIGPIPFFDYTIILTVRDNEGLEDTDTVTIIVNNYPPVAIAHSDITSAKTNQNITFDGTDSYDRDGTITTYMWDFDDGTTALGPTAQHDYANDGVYNVTLTVWDNLGANDTDWIIITIANREPVIENVTVDPASPIVDEEVTITINAIDEDGTIERYYWNFGDGNTYFENTTEYPDGTFDGVTTHTYTSKGSYNVLIEVTDDDTLTNSTVVVITLVNAVPEVTIDNPGEGETVSEITTISGTSTDRDDSVSLVQVKIDDGNWVEAQDTSSDDSWSTWSYDWDTEDGYANGDHMIYVMAYDGENYTEPPANVSVTVDNLPASITVTIDLDPETVEAEGTVSVYGTVIYNTGDPVEGASINVTILNEVGGWETTTSSGGSYTVDITAPDTSGNYRVYVDAVKDSFSDTQYQFLTVIPLPEKPDLTLTSNDIDFNPSAPFSGETVQITITVYNIGDSNANNVLVNVYDGNPQAGGTSIGSKTTSIPANGQTDVFMDWATTGITGTYTVNVILDPNNDIEEDDEGNNQAQKPITITGKPDFTLESSDITFSKESPGVGDPISILIRIYNDGAESGAVNYEVYEGDPDLGGILIDSKEETIAKNDDKTVIVQWTPEEGGEYDIYVVLDPDDDVDEIDEDNNEAYASVSVKEEPKDGGFPSWMLAVMIVIVVVVVIILFFMYMRGRSPRGPRPQRQELPLAQVVESEPKQQAKKTSTVEEEGKEVEASLGGHGGIRIG